MTNSVFDKLTQIIEPYRETFSRFVQCDEYVMVLGGSHSFGLADSFSDVDIFVIWNVEPAVWHSYLPMLCLPQNSGIGIYHIVPILAARDLIYRSLFHGDMNIPNDVEITALFNLSHYIPLHDTNRRIADIQAVIRNLGRPFWETHCRETACTLIDSLEAFYDAVKRNDMMTVTMCFGTVLRGILELALLSEKTLYPQPKWLWYFLKRQCPAIYSGIRSSQLTERAIECMEAYIRASVIMITDKLRSDAMLFEYILDDLIDP